MKARLPRTLAIPVIILLSLLSLGALTLGYWINVRALEKALDEKEHERLAAVAYAAIALIRDEQPRLSALAKALQDNERITQGFDRLAETDDITTLREAMNNLYVGLNVSVFQASDQTEKVLYRAQAPDRHGDTPVIWGVAEALAGEEITIVSKGPLGLALRVVTPIRRAGRIVGTLMVGQVLDDAFARRIAQRAGAEASFASPSGVWASSAPPERRLSPDDPGLTHSLSAKTAIEETDVVARKRRMLMPLKIVDEVFVLVIESDISGSYALLRESKQALLLKSLWILSGAILVGAAFTAYLLRPLKRLQLEAQALVQRISGQEIETDGVNEIGAAVRAFEVTTEVWNRYTANLEIARHAADAANLAKSQFLANMSHEIRTPMNGVLGMLELLLRDRQLSSRQQRYAELAQTSAKSLLRMIDDVFDFSQIEAGQLELVYRVFNPREIINEVAMLFAEVAQQKGIHFATQVDPKLPTAVRGDPGRLRQILSNLMDNAIKFTEQGSVTLEASVVDERAETYKGKADAGLWLRFAVRDTGIGVAPEVKEQIFEAFAQADSSAARRYGGAGLGLTIASRLVKMMGGNINLVSEPGCGSQFSFSVRVESMDAPTRNEAVG